MKKQLDILKKDKLLSISSEKLIKFKNIVLNVGNSQALKQFTPKDLKEFQEFFKIGKEITSQYPFVDWLGLLLESIGQLDSKLGQFFTPFSIVDFMCDEIYSYQNIQENKEKITILDPACGSGRFLIRYAKRLLDETNQLEDFVFFGIDISEVAFSVTLWNLIFHNLNGVVVHGNSLLDDEVWTIALVKRNKEKGHGQISILPSPYPPIPQIAELTALFENKILPNNMKKFDVILTNPPYGKIKFQDPDFFEKYITNYSSLSKRDQQESKEKLLADQRIKQQYEKEREFFKNYQKNIQNKYSLQENRADLDLHKLFVERIIKDLAQGAVGILTSGSFVVDKSATKLRKYLLDHYMINKIIGLTNKENLFNQVDSNQKFIILLLDLKNTHSDIELYGWEQNINYLSEKQLFKISVSDYKQLDKNFYTFFLDTDGKNLEIFQKIMKLPYIRNIKNPGFHYWQEYHATKDSKYFNDKDNLTNKEKLSNQVDSIKNITFHYWREYDATNDSKYFNDKEGKYLLFSGKAIEQYDCIAKKWIKNHGRKSIWTPFPLNKIVRSNYPKNYQTEYYVIEVPDRIKKHHSKEKSNYRIVLRNVTGTVNNVRTIYACLLHKKHLTNNSLHNVYIGKSDEELLFYLALLNSFVLDWQARLRTSTNLNKFIIESLLIPSFEAVTPEIREEIIKLSLKLSALSPDFDELVNSILKEDNWEKVAVFDEKERQKIKNRIDVLVAKIYNLTTDEFEHILNSFSHLKIETRENIIKNYNSLTDY